MRGALYLDRLLAEPEIRDRVVAYAAGVVPDLSAAEPRWLGAARAARVPLVVQSATAARVMETLADYPLGDPCGAPRRSSCPMSRHRRATGR
ncbi:hypothetical protein ACFOHS_23080 [Jhaorihella thermophila]